MDRLKGKVAIVTGGASGQGAAEARLFVAQGAKVVIADLNAEWGQALAKLLGGSAIFFKIDVSDSDQWSRLVAKTLETFGGIDILINSAALYDPRSIKDTDAASLRKHIDVNVMGTYHGMKAVIPHMIARGGGSIVNISSGLALRSLPKSFAYSTTKWAIRGLSRCAALDLADDKIRVNTVFPGLIDTPMLSGNPPEHLEFMRNLIPMKRLGQTDEVAKAVLFLVSDEASYLTGAELSVDGGINM